MQRLANKIDGIIWIWETCLQDKENLIKHNEFHPKEAVWVKPSHLDHLLDMVAKFKQERGHEFGVKRITKKKKFQEEVA
jgi:hypothetical protein